MTRLNISTLSAGGYNGLVAVEQYLGASGLGQKLISLVKLRVSQINGCAYCLHMHREEALKAGDSDARLIVLPAWRESRMFTPRERAALAWAEAVTHIDSDRAEDETYDTVKAVFSDQDMADLTLLCAVINAWNRIAVPMRMVHPADKPAE